MDRPSIYSWAWDFGDGGQVSNFVAPSYQYSNEGTYDVTLTVVDTNGCKNKTVKKALVEVGKMVSVFVPNAFSPNGDGVNDFFALEYRLIDEFLIVIYDRWGNQVYTSTDLKFRWDGTTNGAPNPDGTYVYVIKGKAADGAAVQVGGNVILIR
jgi:gliding motility-associated-like protein